MQDIASRGSTVLRFTRPPTADLLVAFAVAALAELEVWLADIPGPRGVSASAALLLGVALAWRRRAPLAVALAVVGTYNAEILLGVPKNAPSAPVLAIVIAMYSLGARGTARRAVLGGALALAISWGVLLTQSIDATDFPFVATVGLAPLVLGRALSATRREASQAGERAERAERERERWTAEAVAEERARIARELHDVISHSISVMGVQAGAVRRLLPQGNEELEHTLRSVEDTGREALGEMRRLLGIVRAGEEPGLAPQPGLARVDELVDQARRAGLAVVLQAGDGAAPLPPGLDLAAYRIVQEALTNVRRHAPGAQAEVLIRRGERELEIVVTDDGPGAGGRPHAGHGIIGMRERAALYGGQLDVGRAPGGGFEVRARLPLQRPSR